MDERASSLDRDRSLPSLADTDAADLPAGVDRRTFLMRTAVVGAAAVLTGREVSAAEQKAKASADAAKSTKRLSTDLK